MKDCDFQKDQEKIIEFRVYMRKKYQIQGLILD